MLVKHFRHQPLNIPNNMNLVGYSDSEGSDNEVAPTPQSAPKAPVKLINPSTHKIKVNLTPLTGIKDDIEEEAPPAKKPRTGGGGLDINAFLPAPKKKVSDIKAPIRRNLRTGAEPSFSREPQPDIYGGGTGDNETTVDNKEAELLKPVLSEATLAQNRVRFRPLCAPKNVKKKKAVKATPAPAHRVEMALEPEVPKLPPAKPRVSLFSMNSEKTDPVVPSTSTTEYDPVALEHDDVEEEIQDHSYDHQQLYGAPVNPSANTVDSLTSNMNLSAADMRQLFGRKGGKRDMPDLSGINVVNFNTDAEYAANNEIIAKGETVAHKSVRAIAPGKHSLKQLVNAASSQQEALEEHFAKGRRNKAEGAARYGW